MRRIALPVALGALLAGCGGSADYGPLAVYSPHGVHYESNILDGVVQIGDGCMTVRRLGEDILLIFPADEVTWDASTSTFTYDGASFHDGDTFTFPAIVHYGRNSGSIPEACPFVRRVYVLEEGAA